VQAFESAFCAEADETVPIVIKRAANAFSILLIGRQPPGKRPVPNRSVEELAIDFQFFLSPPLCHRSDFDALKAQIEQLQAEVTKLETEKGATEAIAAGHRADFERERERSDKLMTNTMTLASVAMSARAKAARLESELTARQSQFWMRPRTRRRATASEQFRPNALPRPEQPIMQLESIPAAAGRVRAFAELAALVMFAALITAFVKYGIPFLVR
jgi:hypothetical protein